MKRRLRAPFSFAGTLLAPNLGYKFGCFQVVHASSPDLTVPAPFASEGKAVASLAPQAWLARAEPPVKTKSAGTLVGLTFAAKDNIDVAGMPTTEPLAAAATLLYESALVAERYAAIRAFFDAHEADVMDPVRSIIAKGRDYSAAELYEAQTQLRALGQTAAAMWRDIAVLLVPTAPTH